MYIVKGGATSSFMHIRYHLIKYCSQASPPGGWGFWGSHGGGLYNYAQPVYQNGGGSGIGISSSMPGSLSGMIVCCPSA